MLAFGSSCLPRAGGFDRRVLVWTKKTSLLDCGLAEGALVSCLCLAALSAACSSKQNDAASDGGQPAPSASQTALTSASPTGAQAAPKTPLSPAMRQGGALVRTPQGDALFVADEDHKALRRLPLPLKDGAEASLTNLPGAPAEALALDGAVLVTIRDPGLLLVMKPDALGNIVEAARVSLPADAWGLAVDKDARFAYVSSAWTHQVSKVDLTLNKVVWTVDTPREPRGLVVLGSGDVVVSHLVGPDLTRIREERGGARAEPVALAPSPVRAPSGKKLHAALGYAVVTNESESRVFVARHAVGALARRGWYGQPTVDVLVWPGAGRQDAPSQLSALHVGGLPAVKSRVAELTMIPDTPVSIPGRDRGPFVQPRAMVHRQKSNTLLVAGEGDDVVTELDAVALDPTLAVVRIFQVGQKVDPNLGTSTECGAPSGLVLSPDEDTAYVFCRATYDIVALDLGAPPKADLLVRERKAYVHLAEDSLGEEAAKGRRLFYNATDPILSGGLGCAGCHPEGRDDAHVWHEATFDTIDGLHTNFVGAYENIPDLAKTKGFPRRTPMLAGNVKAAGPYGWHGESADLGARLTAAMGLHRWGGMPQNIGGAAVGRASFIATFLREGLVPPPREERELNDVEKRGREIFMSDKARCAKCHVPETNYTDRTPYPLPKLPKVSDFDEETGLELKTPSLRFVGNRAPYFHDGRASTLEKLIEMNGDRMGNTSHLSAEERGALVAFLNTL